VEKIDEKAEHSTPWSRIKNCRWCLLITPYWGVLLALLSAVLMTSYTAMIKLLDQMDSMQVFFPIVRTFIRIH
jgi:drug/metabolite transporter (DMT)-like permease